MVPNSLSEAVELIKKGNKAAALPILKQIIKAEPGNEDAWLWLFACVDDISQKKFCLQKALEINPGNLHARKALEKLTEPKVEPKVEPVRFVNQPAQQSHVPAQSPSIQRLPEKQPVQTKKAVRNYFLIIGIIIFVFLVCIGGIAMGGISIYRQYRVFSNQSIDSQNTPSGSIENKNTPGSSHPTPIATSVRQVGGNSSTPTSTDPAPSLDIRFSPYHFAKTPESSGSGDGWDIVKIAFAIENYSDSLIRIDGFYFENTVIRTSDGNKYQCSSPHISDRSSYIMLSHFRLLDFLECRVPSPSSGFTVSLKLAIESTSMSRPDSCFILQYKPPYRKPCLKSDISVDFNPEQTNPNMTFPLIQELDKDIETYTAKQDMSLLRMNQPIDFFDATMTVNLFTPTEPFVKGLFKAHITSKYIAGDTVIQPIPSPITGLKPAVKPDE